MQRWKIRLEYNGTHYAGWQIQPTVKTVQGQLHNIFERFFKHPVDVQGAGRTDSGVHATGQVAHFDVGDSFPIGTTFTAYKMREALNYALRRENISVLQAYKAHRNFHARFSAKARIYIYRISNRSAKTTFYRNLLWHPKSSSVLDARKMHDAAQIFVGTHDFTTFRSQVATHQNPVRTIEYIRVRSIGEEIHIKVKAPSFLHNQVRYIVGALQLVGYGHWEKQKVKAILNIKDRRKGGPLAPPHGLYLSKVCY